MLGEFHLSFNLGSPFHPKLSLTICAEKDVFP